ncbi:hypothetical protein GY45DRAFT_1366755 [Cubamyces sp. BRFM 1775]|nr:hypothetical protein GY45DRAFT_1366755 [Cubamyces sp. BRFM 1775]
MDLDLIMNSGDIGGIRTATPANTRVMDAPLAAHYRRSTRQRSEKPSGAGRHQLQHTPPTKRAQRKRLPDQHRYRARGGAKPTTLPVLSPARMDATSPRHRRHRQPPSPPADRPLGSRRSPHHHSRSKTMPPSSPAKDLLRRAQQSAAKGADALGRRPFVMDLILGSRPAVKQYSEDVIMEAIELSRDALKPTAGLHAPEDGRRAELRGGWRSAGLGSCTAAGGGSPQSATCMMNPGYQVSAERSTAVWSPDELSLP